MTKEELKSKILEEYEKGNIVLATGDGLAVYNLEEFIKQPTEGMLYDLNRLPEVTLSFLNDPKWINDYAVAVVISNLKRKIAAQQNAEGDLQQPTTSAAQNAV